MTNSRNDAPTGSEGQDPYQEPENSTVEDWLGQRVQRDEERIDALVEQSDGDVAEAERRFEDESHEADEYHAAHHQNDAPATESQGKIGRS